MGNARAGSNPATPTNQPNRGPERGRSHVWLTQRHKTDLRSTGESIFAYLYAYYEDRRGYEIGSFGIESFYRYQETFQRSDRRAFLVARELILRM